MRVQNATVLDMPEGNFVSDEVCNSRAPEHANTGAHAEYENDFQHEFAGSINHGHRIDQARAWGDSVDRETAFQE